MTTRWLACGALVTACGAVLAGQGRYPDPDASSLQAAARAAITNARILDVIGVSRGVGSLVKELGAKVTDREIRIALSADVLFDFDKFALRPEAAASLLKVGEIIKAYPTAPVLIEGHTDGKGAHAYNIKLSENRAAAVKSWLGQNAAVDAARIRTAGWGETKPVAPNTKPDGSDDADGRQKNRRVEITLQTR